MLCSLMISCTPKPIRCDSARKKSTPRFRHENEEEEDDALVVIFTPLLRSKVACASIMRNTV